MTVPTSSKPKTDREERPSAIERLAGLDGRTSFRPGAGGSRRKGRLRYRSPVSSAGVEPASRSHGTATRGSPDPERMGDLDRMGALGFVGDPFGTAVAYAIANGKPEHERARVVGTLHRMVRAAVGRGPPHTRVKVRGSVSYALRLICWDAYVVACCGAVLAPIDARARAVKLGPRVYARLWKVAEAMLQASAASAAAGGLGAMR